MSISMRLHVFLLLLTSAAISYGAEEPWSESFTAAKQQAEAERKLILLHFHSDDCPPCERVESDVFPDPQVKEALTRNYVPLKVHVKQQPVLAQKYSVKRWPTDVIVSAAGQEIARGISPQSPEKYCYMLDQIALQSGVGAGRVAGGGYLPKNNGAVSLPSPQATTAVAQAAWNDTPPANPNAAPAAPASAPAPAPAPAPANANQPWANPTGMIVNPWINQANQTATQAANTAGQTANQATNAVTGTAQQWNNFAQQQTQQATQTVQQQADAVSQQANQWQAGVQQRASQYQAAAEQSMNQYQATAQQTANQWQEQAGQMQQRAEQQQAAGAKAVQDYAANANRTWNGYQEAAQQQVQEKAAAASQTIDTYRSSAAGAVDYIANATTMPSQMPGRRSSYGGSELVTDTAPQIGTSPAGTADVPRTSTIRTGEAAPAGVSAGPYQPVPSGQAAGQVASNRPRVTPGPYSSTQAQPPINTAPGYAPTVSNNAPPLAGSMNASSSWSVPPTTNAAPASTPTPPPAATAGRSGNAPAPEASNNWQANPYAQTNPYSGTSATPVIAAVSSLPPSASRSWNAESGTATETVSSTAAAPVAPAVVPPSAPPVPASPTMPPAAPSFVDSRPHAEPAAAAPAPPAGNFAMDGFCPVTLLETKKWVVADKRFGVVHRGQTYIFASEAEQKKFLGNPDRYSPVLGGNDPVLMADGGAMKIGKREHGIIYKDQIYLFTDEATLATFSQAPDRYAGTAYQAMMETDRTTQRR